MLEQKEKRLKKAYTLTEKNKKIKIKKGLPLFSDSPLVLFLFSFSLL